MFAWIITICAQLEIIYTHTHTPTRIYIYIYICCNMNKCIDYNVYIRIYIYI